MYFGSLKRSLILSVCFSSQKVSFACFLAPRRPMKLVIWLPRWHFSGNLLLREQFHMHSSSQDCAVAHVLVLGRAMERGLAP